MDRRDSEYIVDARRDLRSTACLVAVSDPKLASGTVVLGEVRVDSVVCVRGIGALHRGRSVSGDVPVLVRVMRSDELVRAAGTFANEVLVVRHVEHESVVAPLNADVEGNYAFIAYEPVEGEVLHTILRTTQLSLEEIARIARELGEILDHAHRQPIPLMHASLSAASIVLSGKRRAVRLFDLGVVQALDRANVFEEAIWDVLDPADAAPELVKRTFPIGMQTDVFGLASVMYECLTGTRPFEAKTPADAAAVIISGKRPSAQALRRELTPAVDRLLVKAWNPDPRARPQDILAFARTFADTLMMPARALEEQPTNPTEEPRPEPVADDPTTRGSIPRQPPNPPPRRAATLPFGIKAVTSDPPSPPLAKTIISDPPAAPDAPTSQPALPPPSPLPVEAPMPAPAPTNVAHATAAVDPDVRTVRVVSVTGLVVAMLLAGAIIIAGAFVAGTDMLARPLGAKHEPTPAPPAIAAMSAPPAPVPSPSAVPSAAPSASISASASASSAPSPSVPSDALFPEMAKEPGPRPSAKAVDVLHSRLKTAFEPCTKILPKPPPGTPWMVHFEIDAASGRPVLVEVSRPYKGTVAGACMMREALGARVPPFDGGRWAIDLKFMP